MMVSAKENDDKGERTYETNVCVRRGRRYDDGFKAKFRSPGDPQDSKSGIKSDHR